MADSFRVLSGLDGLRQLAPGGVLSVGNFDGVHLGHQKIIEIMRAHAHARDGATNRARIAAVTFEPHPLTVLRPEIAPPRLTSLEMKRELLRAAGVDDIVELPPHKDVLNLSAEAFWALLRDEVRPRHMVEGSSFNFGKGRGGTIDKLRAWAADSDVTLHVIDGVSVPLLDMQIAPVSSSLIRWLLAHGRVRDAGICLGRPYALRGRVVRGFQRGRTIGMPTANLEVTDQLIPADGVYVGRMCVDGTSYPAAASIGTLPTFDETKRQIEAFLIGFDGDLYGRTLELELIDWIRDQRKFAGIEALKTQIAKDIAIVTERATQTLCTPIGTI